jgi:hypothetical protein
MSYMPPPVKQVLYRGWLDRLLFVCILAFVGVERAGAEALTAEILAHCKSQTNTIRNCYYAREIDKTILAPPFVLFLHNNWTTLGKFTDDSFDPGRGLDSPRMQTLADGWHATEPRLAERIEYRHDHFKKIAGLCPPATNKVQQNDIDLFHRWLLRHGSLPEIKEPDEPLNADELARLAPGAEAGLLKLLQTVEGDPIGRRLLRTALARGVIIRAQNLRDIQAFYNNSESLLVLDYSVLNSEWKINVLVHELVHSVNKGSDNSLVEEAVAQIIGSAVQDRITGIPMACHPYYVFADRLLRYDGLQMVNNISACLQNAGIDCPQGAPPVCR